MNARAARPTYLVKDSLPRVNFPPNESVICDKLSPDVNQRPCQLHLFQAGKQKCENSPFRSVAAASLPWLLCQTLCWLIGCEGLIKEENGVTQLTLREWWGAEKGRTCVKEKNGQGPGGRRRGRGRERWTGKPTLVRKSWWNTGKTCKQCLQGLFVLSWLVLYEVLEVDCTRQRALKEKFHQLQTSRLCSRNAVESNVSHRHWGLLHSVTHASCLWTLKRCEGEKQKGV